MERPVALEDGQKLVSALELLQRGRVRRRRGIAPSQSLERRVQRPGAAGQLLEMADPSVRGDDDPGPGHLGPPTQVEVLAHGHDGRVETSELLEQVGPDQGRPSRGDEHVANRIVLAVVDLVGLHPLHHGSTLVRGHPDMEQPFGIVPADHLGRDDPGIGPERLLHHQVDGVGKQRHVVVAQEEVVGAVHHGPDLVDGGAESPVVLEVSDVGGREDGGNTGSEVLLTPRVQDQHGELRIVLCGDRGERLLEPRTRIVGDDDSDDRRGQCFHQRSEAIGPGPACGELAAHRTEPLIGARLRVTLRARCLQMFIIPDTLVSDRAGTCGTAGATPGHAVPCG